MYVYIDESGDTGYTKKSTRYFILTAVVVDDPFVLRRIAKNVHNSKVGKKKSNMLHAYMETNRVKGKMIKEINNTNITCIVFVLNKREIQEEDPYMYLLKKVCVYFSESDLVNIVLARRDTRKSYNNKIFDIFTKYNLNLNFSNPASEKSLQIADFCSFTIFSHLEHNHSTYFLYLQNRILFI